MALPQDCKLYEGKGWSLNPEVYPSTDKTLETVGPQKLRDATETADLRGNSTTFVPVQIYGPS